MMVVVKLPSFEQIATKWTLAHTIALAAWVVALILGVVLFWRHVGGSYPATSQLKVYAGENATFMYPANWMLNACSRSKPFIELPGTIKSDFKGRQAYAFTIYGTGAYQCMKDRPERFDLYPETIGASDTPCSLATSTRGERLKNGLYLQLREEWEGISGISIRQNVCFAPNETVVLGFAFADPKAEDDDPEKFGPPRVKKEALLHSRQYQDIKALAESFRY
jgi:hypothetical protein